MAWKFHTVKGDALAFVVDTDITDPDNPDNDKEVVIFPATSVRGPETGLMGPVEYRYTHENDQAGGISHH